MRFNSVAEFLDPTLGNHPTAAERDLIEAVQEGRPCWRCDHKNPTRPSADTDQTRIRADLLRLLILGGSKDCGLHERGVSLYGGWIDGELDLAFCKAKGKTGLRYCHFTNKPRFERTRFQLLSLEGSFLAKGLYAQGARVTGTVLLRQVTSGGTIDLAGALIGGQLDSSGAKLDGGKDPAGNQNRAFRLQGAEIALDLYLRKVTASGTVDLNGARIKGQLSCREARFDGGRDSASKPLRALNAQRAEIGNSLNLGGLVAIGTVDVNGAQIGGQLSCRGARLDGMGGKALNAQRLRVMQSLIFRDLGLVSGLIDLASAHVGGLVDDPTSRPTTANDLILNGFAYDWLGGSAPTTLAARKTWLHVGSHWKGEFRPQPYTQFARVLRQMGHASEARKVLMARTRLQAKATRRSRKVVPNGDVSVGFRSLWADCLNLGHWTADRIAFRVAGYGHAPVRSLWCLLGLFLAATALAQVTWNEGSFAPNSAVILASPGWAQATAWDCFPKVDHSTVCDPNPAQTWANAFTASADQPTQGADWDSFNALGYGADLVVPFLDLGQTDAWAPSKDRGDWGWVLWWARWLLAALGWIVTGLGVAAVTGVMQRNQPD